ncbi:universal stress protein [Longispora albida]|uniref:universal stress protein n=1 Tax=Longispora albida TaxID=203523 RepID=UPI00047772FC|nr:universal stress protein [Longispora albida]
MTAQPVASSPVVAGIDGSEMALAAVDWAADAAVLHHRKLRVVHASIWPLMRLPNGLISAHELRVSLREQAQEYLAQAADRALAAHPGLSVETEYAEGAAVPVLVSESREAAMVVLGHRGLGGFTGLLAGSTGVQVSAHAACPVVVVRPESEPLPSAGAVVVGVDGSPNSQGAVGFAFREASLRGRDLVAVHAWRWPQSAEPGDMLPLVYDADLVEAEEKRVFSEALSGWRERYPDVRVTQRMVQGRAGQAIVGASAGAELLVVGARGRGGFAGLLLGSVSQAALHHAACPVAVVRP